MKINVFCLPPAGSSASLYAGWNALTPGHINIVPIEYPGHGARVRQSLTDSPEALTRDIVEFIKSHGTEPFVLFGHSVGAALAWRVEQSIKQTVLSEQLILLAISGRPELDFTRNMEHKGKLSREGLKSALIHYNAIPTELLENNDVMDFFLTILRNDFCLNDNMLDDQIIKTETPLVVFYGNDDPDIADHEQMDAWKKHSSNWLGAYGVAGDHFFFNQPESLRAMLNILCRSITT